MSENTKYVVVYQKNGIAKYISHLDFVRAMNRILRRGGVPVAYSQGFNPHPLLSFALPLSVGTTGGAELLELTLSEPLSPEVLLHRLNGAAPGGVSFVRAYVTEDKNAIKGIAFAKYLVTLKQIPEEQQVDAFLQNAQIVVLKRTKSGEKETDIRPMIAEMKMLPGGALAMTLAAGNTQNLKPETVLLAMEKYILGFCGAYSAIHRETLYDINLKPLA